MVRILIAIIFLLSTSAHAIVPSGVPSGSFGYNPSGSVASKIIKNNNQSLIISLLAGDVVSTTGNYLRFVRLGTSTTNGENYQVTVGKTLYCTGFYIFASAAFTATFGYGTTAVTDDNSTPPTAPKAFTGGAGVTFSTAAVAFTWIPLPMSFPAESFPYLVAQNTSVNFQIALICEEQ